MSEREPRLTPRWLNTAVLLISAVGIAYQIVLMRVFSIAQWHHFASMIISIAMLGFGASGAALALLKTPLKGREAGALRFSAALLTVSLVACYALSQRVPFETYQLVSQPNQIWNLLALYVVLAVPFFLISTCITIAFFLAPGNVARVYFFSMAGSGLGALGVVGLLYLAHPVRGPYILAGVSGLALALLTLDARRRSSLAGAALLLIAMAAGVTRPAPVRVSEYKGLSYAKQLPDAKILGEWHSPMSVITAVSSEQIRETPGQISNYPMAQLGELPEQVALYFDAGAASPVNRFTGDLDPFAYLDYVTSALPYRLVEAPKTLVIGPGGGTNVLGALYHGAGRVVAVEVDPRVFDVVQTQLGDFAGGLYDRPDVTPVIGEGRGFLQSSEETYDLIQIPSLGSFTASTAGVQALSESYFYTVEAVRLQLSRLTPDGVLAITVWLKTPARDALKMVATVVEACEQSGIEEPGNHLAFIRSWNNATIVVSRAPMSANRVEAVRAFCRDRMFDLCYCPGIRPEEANRYTLLDEPVYYAFTEGVLDPTRRESVYRDSLFYVRPATDDRPHFFRFLKWSALPRLIRDLGAEWIPFVEWGYLTLVATILQGLLASAVFILLPLIVLARGPSRSGAKRWVFVYFAALGLAYMALEMGFIQRVMLFLAYPVYSVAVVLTSFLFFSGLGSLFASRCKPGATAPVGWAVLAIALLTAAYAAFLPGAFKAWAGWSDAVKIIASVFLLSPLAFAMGIPFPMGLQRVSDDHPALLPWAWGINGCASVTGATLATLVTVHLGFRVLFLLAVLTYTAAFLAIRRLGAGDSHT